MTGRSLFRAICYTLVERMGGVRSFHRYWIKDLTCCLESIIQVGYYRGNLHAGRRGTTKTLDE